MRIGILLFSCVAFSWASYGQNKSLGVGTPSPSANAALHVESPTNNQGFIMPRLTTSERLAMAVTISDTGLMVYDKDFYTVFTWNGTSWKEGGRLSFPYEETILAGPANSNLFKIVYNGTGVENVGVAAFQNSNPDNGFTTLFVTNAGTNGAGYFQVSNANSLSPSLRSLTNSNQLNVHAFLGRTTGTGGSAGAFEISNASNNKSAITATTNGVGSAGYFESTNITATGATGLLSRINTNISGTAIDGQSFGQAGHGGSFYISNSANSSAALNAITQGLGSAGFFNAFNALNNSPSVEAQTIGTGSAGKFIINNPSNPSSAVYASTNGTGAPTTTAAILGETATAFSAITGLSTGGAANGVSGLSSDPGTGGYAILGSHSGGGPAGVFTISNASNSSTGLSTRTSGTGSAFLANQAGPTGNIAVFQSNNVNVARIDKSGQGFFNGGTTNSGADLAELFEVEGTKNDYEPGDVLVISINTDRTVEKSRLPNSTKVIGVYATKPGVILTEKGIDDNLDELIPMGVVGVIPTKVCLENGPIKRGDLLVTSSKKGHAMKAIPVIINGIEIYPSGAILGKALENFEGSESGLIQVFVNVK